MTNLTEALLGPLLGTNAPGMNPMGPRITYYDDATGERIELSSVTLANWAAKTANLVRYELGVGPDSRVAVFLPAHWQTAAVLLGVWWAGAEVVPADAASKGADVALCTRGLLSEADKAVNGGEVAVLSLDPFGKPAPGLPIGVTDYATAVRVHGDQFIAEPSPGAALPGRSTDDVLAEAAQSAQTQNLTASDRVMSDAMWSTERDIIDNLLAVFAVGASLVQVSNPDHSLLARRRESEKVTRDLH